MYTYYHTKQNYHKLVAVVSPVAELCMVRFKVTMLSQPDTFCKVSTYVPVLASQFPSHRMLSQTVESTVI